MEQKLQFADLNLISLTATELISVDGGDAVNMCYHNGDSQLDWSRLSAICDGVNNFLAGFGSAF